MHFSNFITLLQAGFVAAAALSARDKSSSGTLEKWTDTTEVIMLSELTPFGDLSDNGVGESLNPMTPRDILRRGFEAASACDNIYYVPGNGGRWQWVEATCDRGNPFEKSFTVKCVGERDENEVVKVKGQCRHDEFCIEFHGYNVKGQGAWDITCVDGKTLHKWSIDAYQKQIDQAHGCSASWVNNRRNDVKATFETNAVDWNEANRIGPKDIWYQINGKRIGVTRSYDPDVGSGVIVIPPGGAVQACADVDIQSQVKFYTGITGFGL